MRNYYKASRFSVKLLFLAYFVFSCFFSFGQERDAFLIKADKMESPVKKIVYLNKLADSICPQDPIKANNYAGKALELAISIKNDTLQYSSRFSKGIAECSLADYNSALQKFIDNKALAIQLNQKNKIIESLNAIGNIYKNIERNESALQAYQEALSLCDQKVLTSSLILIKSNLADLYCVLKRPDTSLIYCYEIIDIIKKYESKDYFFISNTYGTLLSNYFYTKNTDSIKKYTETTLAFKKLSPDQSSYPGFLQNLGNYYALINDFKTAEKYYKEALACKPENVELLFIINKELAQILFKQKKHEESAKYYSASLELSDSLNKTNTIDKLSEMEVKYETGKKEEELKRLAITSEMDALKLKNSNTWLLVSVVGILFCILIAALLFRQMKSKQSANKLLEKQNHEILEQKKEITDSINYAKRIQTAILPPARYVDSLLKQNFIFYAPKDIVSGDFYWVDSRDDKVLFAAVDCTGHGVPGALMSVVGYNLLSQAVKEKGLTSPSKILNYLDDGVHQTLRQSQNESGIKDGMDLAICCLHPNNVLEYAGVYNSVCVVRKNISESFTPTSSRMVFYGKDLLEIKSDKLQIGSNENDLADEFTNHQLQLQSGDCVYLYSDGFADQFGGPKGKKFKYNHLKDELISMHSLSTSEQKDRLNSAFKAWKGNLEQVDDILVIGIKI